MGNWVQKTFSDYDLPTGRTVESFAFKLESVWDGVIIDTYYTDDPAEAERMTSGEQAQAYEVRVHHGGSVVIHPQP